MPRLGEWIRNQPAFQRLITRIEVDEGHFIFTAGQSLYGLSAFRPAWGLLDHLKRQLPNRIRWHFFSATFPQHILSQIQSKFLPGGNHAFIHLTSNRPNIMYATHRAEGQIDNVLNYRCFMPSPFVLDAQPRTIIFVDDKKLASRIQKYLRGCLPPAMQLQGIVRHYHSSMSQLYLEQTHEAFVSPSGTCRVLIATSGQSVVSHMPYIHHSDIGFIIIHVGCRLSECQDCVYSWPSVYHCRCTSTQRARKPHCAGAGSLYNVL